MNVSELEGVMLDYWVAHVEGMLRMIKAPPEVKLGAWSPSTKWAHGGPIIEREKIELLHFGSDGGDGRPWEAQIGMDTHYIDQNPGDAIGGPTPLVAAMRCYVASKFGDTVPDEVAG